MNRNHFSNLSFPQPKEAPYEICAKIGPEAPEEKSFEILNIFSHTNAYGSKIDLTVKRSNVNVRPLF